MITEVAFTTVNVADQQRAKAFYAPFTPYVLNTDDLVETCKELEAKGVEVVEQPAVAEWGGWWARIKDSEGNVIGMSQEGSDE